MERNIVYRIRKIYTVFDLCICGILVVVMCGVLVVVNMSVLVVVNMWGVG